MLLIAHDGEFKQQIQNFIYMRLKLNITKCRLLTNIGKETKERYEGLFLELPLTSNPLKNLIDVRICRRKKTLRIYLLILSLLFK